MNEIQSAAIARGVDKQTHETFYVVRSDSDPNTWYHLTWNEVSHDWQCSCPAGSRGRQCKHQAAVNLTLRVRRLQIAVASRPVIREQDTRQAEASHRPSQKGNLNGNRGFSLLK